MFRTQSTIGAKVYVLFKIDRIINAIIRFRIKIFLKFSIFTCGNDNSFNDAFLVLYPSGLQYLSIKSSTLSLSVFMFSFAKIRKMYNDKNRQIDGRTLTEAWYPLDYL